MTAQRTIKGRKSMELPERKIFTVSELTEQIKHLIENEYQSVWIQGEISNFRPAPSGHLYFTLKDESAQIRCVMFRLQTRFLKFRPEQGLSIIAWGRLSVYAPRGEYQIILDTMEPLGIGSLMLAFEQLRDRLAAEGLFDESRKKPLPRFPCRIGLVTSPKGAAVRDMIRILHRRSPGAHILLSPALVQGDRAPNELVQALDRLCRLGESDVVIIGRGGGSMEDLWAFNDERVVRAVAECPLPIVSAVGHETDFTLTDFAADLRASTPSAAAELVVPDRLELLDGLTHLAARLKGATVNRIDRVRGKLSDTLSRFYDPRRSIQERRLRLDELATRLTNATRGRMEASRREARTVTERLRPEHLNRTVRHLRDDLDRLGSRLAHCARDAPKDSRRTVQDLAARLDGLSPLAVLSRGYSITLRPETGEIIRDAASVTAGEDLEVRLHNGALDCRVINARTEEQDA